MTPEEAKALKARVLEALPASVLEWEEVLEGTDHRLLVYCLDVATDEEDTHNLYEVLAVRKFCRLLGCHEWRPEAVQQFIRLYEGLKFSGLDGRREYRLTPVQVFQFASIFGFHKEDGTRLCRQAILFVPRKFGKSTGVASLGVNELLFGDANAQGYMAANSSQQAGICYKEAKALIQQLDPQGRLFRTTQGEINWLPGNPLGREGSLTKLTAGGRTKDGLNASLVIFDEYAASRYVRDHSDGAELLNVLTSSMGARRDPLTVIITTANRVQAGPFETMLEEAKRALVEEEGADWQFASIFEPDLWEREEESLGSPRVWRKCNPHIGITIRPDFYAHEWEQAKRDPEKRKEFLCKYLNLFQSDTRRDWIAADRVRSLQGGSRIGDLQPHRWQCFVGLDFSRGDDLCSAGYLCYNPFERRFFVDCDAWITEEALGGHPNAVLYRRWVEQGWLRVCPGRVIPEAVVTERVEELVRAGVVFEKFGYDPYDAAAFINYLKEWIRTHGKNPILLVRPVRQTWGQFNSACQTFQRLVDLEAVEFSPNPLLPWCFGNAVLEEDKFENVKPVKRTANAKIDPVICLLEGIILMEDLQNQKK